MVPVPASMRMAERCSSAYDKYLNMPVEALEIEFPIILVKKYELRKDSGGAGQFRGGLGIAREFEIIGDGVSTTCLGDRHKFPPWGLEGGKDGAGGAFYRVLPNGTEIRLSNKCSNHPVNKGDIIRVLTPGSEDTGIRLNDLLRKFCVMYVKTRFPWRVPGMTIRLLSLCDENGDYVIDVEKPQNLELKYFGKYPLRVFP